MLSYAKQRVTSDWVSTCQRTSAAALVLMLAACAGPQTATTEAPLTPAPTPITEPTKPAAVVHQRMSTGRLNGEAYGDLPSVKSFSDALAREYELPLEWTIQTIAQARYRETVAKLMMPGASSTAKNWAAYRSRFVEPIRIKAGQTFWRNYQLDLQRAQTEYGVPAPIIAGILGVETIYGKHTGNFRVLDALATLSLDFPSGRSDRSAFFRKELGEFLKLCQEQQWEPNSVQGSYAGAIGWPQFMPSSIRRYAVDFDQDGRIDLRRSPVDAIGSVARYLAMHGWRTQRPSHFDVVPPSDPLALSKLLEPDIRPSFTPKEMKELGTKLPDPALEYDGKLALVKLLNGVDEPTLIAGTHNFYAITRYNQSSYYALAVIELGEAVSAP